MTQAELAKAIGASQGNIARLESGQHAPSVRVLQNIAAATQSSLQIDFRPRPMSYRRFDMVQATRRHFIGGAAGMAGVFGLLGPVRHVTAQEATAAASAGAEYVWTPPAYDPEPMLFDVVERNAQSAVVETIDGQVEIPANPQRVVSLGWEYIPLFEAGLTDRLVGVGYDSTGDQEFENAGDLTESMHTALADVSLIPNPWELDIEQVVSLRPDLILSNPWWIEDPAALGEVAPLVRGVVGAPDVPRAAVRDYGALFDQADAAEELIAEHDAYVVRARQAIAAVVEGKKALVVFPAEENFYALPSYYVENDAVFANFTGPYPLHRELGIIPSSTVELLADEDRQVREISLSIEQIGDVDADYLFVYSSTGGYDEFVGSPLVQQTIAAQQGQVYSYDSRNFGYGLAGVRAAVAWIVEMLTGEPFE